jgi:predicted RNA-binding protein (virulence factor B family)
MLPVLLKMSVQMIKIGKQNQLMVDAEFPFGYQLISAYDPTTVILPRNNIEGEVKIGQYISVFVYPGEDGDLTATMKHPLVTEGEIALLKAVGVADFGAFFKWGIERDLLVLEHYQEGPINEGMYYPVYVYYDKTSNRLLGATKLHYFLDEEEPEVKVGEAVELMVYAKTDLGFKMVINNRYLGLLFHSDAFTPLKIGSQVQGYIKHIREDGKIDLALQGEGAEARDSLQTAILEDLDAHGGLSTLTDKSPADEIYARFKVSKAAYKKALGALYKQKKISISKESVKLVNPE